MRDPELSKCYCTGQGLEGCSSSGLRRGWRSSFQGLRWQPVLQLLCVGCPRPSILETDSSLGFPRWIGYVAFLLQLLSASAALASALALSQAIWLSLVAMAVLTGVAIWEAATNAPFSCSSQQSVMYLSLSQPSVKPAVLPRLWPGLLDHQCSLYLRCQAGGCSTATGLLSALLLLLLHCLLIFHAWPSSVMALIQTCWSEKPLPQPIFAMLRNATQEDTSQSE